MYIQAALDAEPLVFFVRLWECLLKAPDSADVNALFLSAGGDCACVRAGTVVKSPRYVLHYYSN